MRGWLLAVVAASCGRVVHTFEAANTLDNGSDDGALVGPGITPTRLPAVLVTVIDVAGATIGLGSAFTPLPQLNGDQAGLALIDAPGTYAPTWTTNSPGADCGATVAFTTP